MAKRQQLDPAPAPAQNDNDLVLAIGLSRSQGMDVRMRLSIPMLITLLSVLSALDSVTTHYLKAILEALMAYV